MAGPPKQFDRDEALARATAVFWAQGLEGTSVEQLLDAMGLSRSSMYSTFGDKKALFLEALQTWIDDAVTAFLQALNGDGPLVDRVLNAFAEKHRAQEKRGNVGCFFGNTLAEGGMADPEIARVLTTFMRRIERVLRQTFDEAVAKGELPATTDTRALTLFLVTFGQGAAVMGRGEMNCFEEMGPVLRRVLESDAFLKVE